MINDEFMTEAHSLVQRHRNQEIAALHQREQSKLDNMARLAQRIRDRVFGEGHGWRWTHIDGCEQCIHAILAMDYSLACSPDIREAMNRYREDGTSMVW